MNRLTYLLCAIVCIVSNCSTKSKTSVNAQNEQIDTLNISVKESLGTRSQAHQSDEERKKSIQGLWAKSPDANMSFRVKGDSLFFFEDPNPIYFEIKQDSFVYYIDGEKSFNKILKLQSDSIVFIENGDIIRLYNRERYMN